MTSHQDQINEASDNVSAAFLDMFPVQTEQSAAARKALAKYLALIGKEVTEASTSAILPFIAMVHTHTKDLEAHRLQMNELRMLVREHTERIDALEAARDAAIRAHLDQLG